MHLGGIDPGFPETSSAAVRLRRVRAVVAVEMDVDDLLQCGADPDLDGP